jgi:hypothetical protein
VTHFLPSSLAQRYVSVVIQTSLQLTITVISDPELVFLKQNWVTSADWSTLDSILPFLCCTEICVQVNKDISGIVRLQLTTTVTFDPELDLLKQNWVMSAEGSTRDSFPPFFSCTEICVRFIQTSMQLTVTLTCDPELDFLKQNWVLSAEWSKHDSPLHSSLAQRYVSGVIQKSFELTVAVIYDPELDIPKENWFMSVEWSTLD